METKDDVKKVNEYQEALDWINEHITWIDSSEFPYKYQIIFRDLLNKSIPKKPVWSIDEEERTCPNCKDMLDVDNALVCDHCYQKLDLSKDEKGATQ